MILEIKEIPITPTENPANTTDTTESLTDVSDKLNGTVFSTDMVPTHYDATGSPSLTNYDTGTVSSSVTDGYQGPAG